MIAWVPLEEKLYLQRLEQTVDSTGLPQTFLAELHAELEARKAERDAEKPIGTKLNSPRARLQRATTKGAKAKTALEATEKVPGCDEGTNTELQELMAGSIAWVSTDGSDAVSRMAAAMEQLLLSVETCLVWKPSRTVERCSSM